MSTNTLSLDSITVRKTSLEYDQDYTELEAQYYEYLEENHPELVPKSWLAPKDHKVSTYYQRHVIAEIRKRDRLMKRACSKKSAAAKLAALDGIKDYLVANTNIISFDRGTFMSSSTGRSKDYRDLRAGIDKSMGIERQKPGPKGKSEALISTGDSRARVVSNAMQQAANRIKVLTDDAIKTKTSLRMQTLTFSDKMPIKDRFDAFDRILFLFRRHTERFVSVWGIGEGKHKEITQSIRTLNRLHLHLHMFTTHHSDDAFAKAVETVMQNDTRFAGMKFQVNNQVLGHKELTKKGYHMATYGSVNLASFKPNRLKDLVEEEYYSQRAIEEFDSARFKMRLYVAGSAVNRELRERSHNEEVPIVRNGQDACNQVLRRFADARQVHVEQMDIGVSEDGSKFWANHDESTVTSYRRVLDTRYVAGDALPLGMYRAWTMYKETDYRILRSFYDFVMGNQDVFNELESKRLARANKAEDYQSHKDEDEDVLDE